MINSLRGFSCSLTQMPTDVSINIVSYLNKKDVLTRISGLNWRFNDLSKKQELWRSLSLQSMNEVTTDA
jgi:hypothetical protein